MPHNSQAAQVMFCSPQPNPAWDGAGAPLHPHRGCFWDKPRGSSQNRVCTLGWAQRTFAPSPFLQMGFFCGVLAHLGPLCPALPTPGWHSTESTLPHLGPCLLPFGSWPRSAPRRLLPHFALFSPFLHFIPAHLPCADDAQIWIPPPPPSPTRAAQTAPG